MSKVESKIDDAPGFEDIGNLFPPSSSASPSPISNVSMKLPTYLPDPAEVWFAQTDTQFVIHNMSVSKTKFYHAVAVLPQEVASQILDLIRSSPTRDPYQVLKKMFDKTLHHDDYPLFQGSGVSSPLRRPETLGPDEQNVSSSP